MLDSIDCPIINHCRTFRDYYSYTSIDKDVDVGCYRINDVIDGATGDDEAFRGILPGSHASFTRIPCTKRGGNVFKSFRFTSTTAPGRQLCGAPTVEKPSELRAPAANCAFLIDCLVPSPSCTGASVWPGLLGGRSPLVTNGYSNHVRDAGGKERVPPLLVHRPNERDKSEAHTKRCGRQARCARFDRSAVAAGNMDSPSHGLIPRFCSATPLAQTEDQKVGRGEKISQEEHSSILCGFRRVGLQNSIVDFADRAVESEGGLKPYLPRGLVNSGPLLDLSVAIRQPRSRPIVHHSIEIVLLPPFEGYTNHIKKPDVIQSNWRQRRRRTKTSRAVGSVEPIGECEKPSTIHQYLQRGLRFNVGPPPPQFPRFPRQQKIIQIPTKRRENCDNVRSLDRRHAHMLPNEDMKIGVGHDSPRNGRESRQHFPSVSQTWPCEISQHWPPVSPMEMHDQPDEEVHVKENEDTKHRHMDQLESSKFGNEKLVPRE